MANSRKPEYDNIFTEAAKIADRYNAAPYLNRVHGEAQDDDDELDVLIRKGIKNGSIGVRVPPMKMWHQFVDFAPGTTCKFHSVGKLPRGFLTGGQRRCTEIALVAYTYALIMLAPKYEALKAAA